VSSLAVMYDKFWGVLDMSQKHVLVTFVMSNVSPILEKAQDLRTNLLGRVSKKEILIMKVGMRKTNCVNW
jgi:hypothetical protein